MDDIKIIEDFEAYYAPIAKECEAQVDETQNDEIRRELFRKLRKEADKYVDFYEKFKGKKTADVGPVKFVPVFAPLPTLDNIEPELEKLNNEIENIKREMKKDDTTKEFEEKSKMDIEEKKKSINRLEDAKKMIKEFKSTAKEILPILEQCNGNGMEVSQLQRHLDGYVDRIKEGWNTKLQKMREK
jgi:DNA repair exonuclease SbcCD ATPase subunit